MKNLLTAIVMMLPMTAFANEYTVPMLPEHATVYHQGAKVTARSVRDLPTGHHTIHFLVPPNTVDFVRPQIKISGARLLGTQIKNTPSQPVKESYLTESQQALLDAHEFLHAEQQDAQAKHNLLTERLEALEIQAAYLASIKPSNTAPQSFEDLSTIADYLPNALSENAVQQANLNRFIKQEAQAIRIIENDLRRSKQTIASAGIPDMGWNEISLDILVERQGSVDIKTTFFSSLAEWVPSYDINLDDTTNQITVKRTASISQRTGQGWDNVTIRLSSANPLQRVNASHISRDIVDSYYYDGKGIGTHYQTSSQNAQMRRETDVLSNKSDRIEASFDLKTPNNISATGDPAIVPLAALTLTAGVDRYANARADEHAFVRAQFTNDTGEPILAGNANYFRNGVMVGKDTLEKIAANAESTLFFGPDETLPITWQRLSEMSGNEGFLKRSNTQEEKIAFTVHNIGDTKQNIVLSYATPISFEQNLTSVVTTFPQATRSNVDGKQGVLEWDIPLNAGKSHLTSLKFNLTFPEGHIIDWRP